MRQSPSGSPGKYHGGPPQPRAARRRTPVAAYVGLGLICLVLAAGAAAATLLVVAPPLDAVRDRLVHQVHQRTGRTLTVAGPVSVSLLPSPTVTVEGVALQPPDGMAGEPTVRVPSLVAEVSLWSLLSRRPKLEKITLLSPSVDLIVDGNGRRSWDAGARPKSTAPPSTARKETPQDSTRQRRPRPLVLRVSGGSVRFRDERSGVEHRISGLDMDLTSDPAEAGLAAVGAFVWEGEPFRFSVAARPEADQSAVIRLSGAPLELAYEGRLAVQGGVSAEGTLSLAHVVYKEMKLGPAKLALLVASGATTITLQELALYGGSGQGRLTVDTTGAKPSVAANLTLSGVSLMPLLKDAARATWLDGRGTVSFALSGEGATAQQIVESLQGQAQLAVNDGAVAGFDVERMLQAVQRGRLDRLAPRRQDRTPFSALSSTFVIAGGIAKTSDLQLVSKQVALKGEGQIELWPRLIDATLEAKIEGGPSAEGAVVSIGKIELPIGIKGPLDRPEFSIKGQQALSDAIGRVAKGLKSPEARDAIEGLLSGDRSKRVKPGELLEKLFKKE